MDKEKMKKRIVFIRHAQSKANAGQIYSEEDFINCKLTELGKNQAKRLDFSFDILIVSPLKRALETYTNSNIKVGNVVISHLFQEHKVGKPNMLDNVDHSRLETEPELHDRVENAWRLLESMPEKHIGIISHHDFIYALFKRKFNMDVSLNNTDAYFVEIPLNM